MGIKSKSEIISKILSPALSFWLRSQVDQVEELQIKITGGDRQILGGYIPSVFLTSSYVVYQGIHLSEVELNAENIRINLGQILQGKPLRLLESILVIGKVFLTEADLHKSISSPLLSSGLTDLIQLLLESGKVNNAQEILQGYQVSWQEITLKSNQFILRGNLTDKTGKTTELLISSGLSLSNSHTLLLHPLNVSASENFADISLENLEIDLGKEVAISELNLIDGGLGCVGSLTVQPEVEPENATD